MKLKRGKKMTCGRNAYARYSKTLASVNLKFSKLGKCNLHFLPRGLNIGLIKILRSCAYLVRYALRARRATKALRCFTILTLTLFLRCIFQIPPLRQPKDSGNAKMPWHVCASCHYDVSSFPTYLQRNRTPARVNLWVGGWLPARVDCVENCGQA